MVTEQDVIVDPPQPGAVMTAADIFGDAQPFELEIGCGKGGYLLKRAQSDSTARLLGIEWANKYFRFAADRMARWQITNVRLLRTDARHFVIHHLAAETLTAIHVYHPDPWPKKRHHKRRLFQSEFVDAGNRALVHGGRWFIQTDHRQYFDWILDVMNRSNAIERHNSDAETVALSAPDEFQGTNFEIKYRNEGRKIYRAMFVRRSDPSPPLPDASGQR